MLFSFILLLIMFYSVLYSFGTDPFMHVHFVLLSSCVCMLVCICTMRITVPLLLTKPVSETVLTGMGFSHLFLFMPLPNRRDFHKGHM